MNDMFLTIGVILTFIGTMITIYFTRRNLKTTKYIDTITSERIKWLETIRNEVTNIICNIHFTLEIYSDDIQNNLNSIIDYQDNIEAQIEEQTRYFDAPTSLALGQRKNIWSKSDYIKSLYLFKLRLNPVEDKNIIEIIDFFIKFYTESKSKSANEIPEAREKIISLTSQT